MFFVFSLNIYVYIYYIFFWNWNAINFCKLFALVLFLSFFLLLSFKLFSISSHFAFRLFRGARGGRGTGDRGDLGVGICMVWLMHLWPICMYVYVYYMYSNRQTVYKAKESALKVLPAFRRLLSLSTSQYSRLRKCPCFVGRCCVYVCGCMCVCMCCCCYPFFCYCLINIIKTFVSFLIHSRQHFSLSFS